MPAVTVVAQLTVREEAIESVQAELLKLIDPTRAEEGCIEYRLHQDNDNPSQFIFYENWENMACLERHMNSDHFKRYIAAVGDQVTHKVVQKLTEIC
ncbi:putative monooxygenase [Geobacter sp. OR-1]|uniref:putative quinol monooxygenase n=1 Tax=Geobacter sp. OR-1 TaxID=1266765 RepID=UPI000543A535|nr:putative quinol monooxygenase [Geobacter sp. OR-1]GAM10378.1 putative monooxygenase [Geobacter sp. OR-1]